MSPQADAAEQPQTDGRRARRDRGRVAVTDAMIDLVLEGFIPPTVDQVSERAGVSAASIFRYFDTLDDLRQATLQAHFERYSELFELPNIGVGTLETRVDGFVKVFTNRYEQIAPMAKLIRLRSSEQLASNDLLQHLRTAKADQIRQHFARELASLRRSEQEDIVVIASTLTSYDSWEEAREGHNRTPAQIRSAWTMALIKLFGS